MRNVLFSFLMAGALVMGGCADHTDRAIAYQSGKACSREYRAQDCYAACRKHGPLAQLCRKGVTAERR